jgi:hypothetical protein
MPHDGHHSHDTPPDGWKHSGVRVIPGDSLDSNTAQTPGMNRAAAINLAGLGRRKSGPARCISTPMPRPARIIMVPWRA